MTNLPYGFRAIIPIELFTAFVPLHNPIVEMPGEYWFVRQVNQVCLSPQSFLLFAQRQFHGNSQLLDFTQLAGTSPNRNRKNEDDRQNQEGYSKTKIEITKSLAKHAHPAKQERNSHNY